MRKALIIGFDPGITVGISCLDFNGNILFLKESKDEKFTKIISDITRIGKPIIITTDKIKAPKNVLKLKSLFNAKLILPNKEDLEKEKDELITNLLKENKLKKKIKSNHIRDSLYSAYKYYLQIKDKYEKIEYEINKNLICAILKKSKSKFNILRPNDFEKLKNEILKYSIIKIFLKDKNIKNTINSIIKKKLESKPKIKNKNKIESKNKPNLHKEQLANLKKDYKLLKDYNKKIEKENKDLKKLIKNFKKNSNKTNLIIKSNKILNDKQNQINFLNKKINKQIKIINQYEKYILNKENYIFCIYANNLIDLFSNSKEFEKIYKIINNRETQKILLINDLDKINDNLIKKLIDYKFNILVYFKASLKNINKLKDVLKIKKDSKLIKVIENKPSFKYEKLKIINKKEIKEINTYSHNEMLQNIINQYKKREIN
jgi:hypothetical protein